MLVLFDNGIKGFNALHVCTYATEFGVKGRYTSGRSVTEAYHSALLVHDSSTTRMTGLHIDGAKLNVGTYTRIVALLVSRPCGVTRRDHSYCLIRPYFQ